MKVWLAEGYGLSGHEFVSINMTREGGMSACESQSDEPIKWEVYDDGCDTVDGLVESGVVAYVVAIYEVKP